MNRGNAPQDPEEALIDRSLRALAPRRAPAGLEARVIGELRRRAALPWWRRSFAHWPRPPRLALLVACAALAPVAWRACAWAGGAVEALARRAGAPISLLRDVLRTAIDAQSSLRLFDGIVSPAWMVGGLVFAALLYVMLLGLGAVAYRALYLRT
ncbi:MAG TPA: hypothetical protein VMV25_04350 [Steroidobacteraceae bacterium]|nr:hypothetical protein [Steroidobacteraceae bacterium]HVC02655.1 hypothetical protein [Steroidobacteraceae bacterium]